MLLEFAGRRYVFAAHQEAAIRDELNMSALAFWAHVSRLLDDPPADLVVEFGPTLARLRRLRASRGRQRHSV